MTRGTRRTVHGPNKDVTEKVDGPRERGPLSESNDEVEDV